MKENKQVEEGQGYGLGLGRCKGCKESQIFLQKHKKLIDLLRKKIRQLQKKGNRQVSIKGQNQISQLCHLENTLIVKPSPIQSEMLKHQMKRCMSLETQEKELPVRKDPMAMSQQLPKRDDIGFGGRDKVYIGFGIAINGLTEKVIQLKSNLMHIRHCVYAIFKELHIGDRIRESQIALSITHTLMSMFQFSQNERAEMFGQQKVKLRRKERKSNKENIFVTIKQI